MYIIVEINVNVHFLYVVGFKAHMTSVATKKL